MRYVHITRQRDGHWYPARSWAIWGGAGALEWNDARWAESDANFLWLCARHHRGFGGVHHAAAADWEAAQYVQNLLAK